MIMTDRAMEATPDMKKFRAFMEHPPGIRTKTSPKGF
jgi:hypothetical protein